MILQPRWLPQVLLLDDDFFRFSLRVRETSVLSSIIYMVVEAVTSADACCPAVSRMVLSSVVNDFLAGYKVCAVHVLLFVWPPYTVWGLLPG